MGAFKIDETFSYHTPKGHQSDRYQAIRSMAKQLGYLIQELTPQSGEQTLALRDLQRAVMYANASIAINETDEQASRYIPATPESGFASYGAAPVARIEQSDGCIEETREAAPTAVLSA